MSVYEHPEWLALLRSILAEPEDDTPRLVAADWLDDHGEPERAEFIRVQMELTRLMPRKGTAYYFLPSGRKKLDALRRREQQLLETRIGGDGRSGYWEWMGEVLREQVLLGIRQPDCVAFCRGFVASVTCTAPDWLAHADALLAAHPITEVRLTTVPNLSDWPADCRGNVVPTRGMKFTFTQSWPGVTFLVGAGWRS